MPKRRLKPAAAAALALAGLPAAAALAADPPGREALQARVDAVRAALAEPGADPAEISAQTPNWTNWPKWTKWANWANK